MMQERYKTEVDPRLMQEFRYINSLAVPKLDKVVLNTGVGVAKENERELEGALQDLTLIGGQKAVPTQAKKAVAEFGIRQGQMIGARVTLRGRRMYEFLEKLFRVVLPRMRDFRGLPRGAFDGRGNYSLGLGEQGVFLEIDPNKVGRPRGLQVTIVTTARSDGEAEKLLVGLGLPLEKEIESTE